MRHTSPFASPFFTSRKRVERRHDSYRAISSAVSHLIVLHRMPSMGRNLDEQFLHTLSIQLEIPLHSAAAFPPLIECLAVANTVGDFLSLLV